MIDQEVRSLVKVLWDYHHLSWELSPSDFILALGCHDSRVAHKAADLMLNDYSPLLVTSGGLGKVTRDLWGDTEGERFAKIAQNMGVSESRILIENTARNFGENVTRTRELLDAKGIRVSTGILVTKPYTLRRAYATAAKQWPEISWLATAPDLSLERYPDGEVPEERMIELMVGDLQRVKVYAAKGFQIPQEVPSEVWTAYEELVRRGYDRFVIKDTGR